MAFGFTPKHVATIPLDGISKENFLVLATDAATAAGWDISYLSAAGFIAITKVSWRMAGYEIKVVISDQDATVRSASLGQEMFDGGRNKANVENLIKVIHANKATAQQDEMASKYDVLVGQFTQTTEDILTQPEATTSQSIFSIFKPIEGYFVTPILIDINVLIYLLMVISGVNFFLPDSESLLQWGANLRASTLDGEWWRLLTCCFIHIGIVHLLFNMYALMYIGILLEPRLGKGRFIAAYLLTGICASLTSLYWHDLTISAGASGAIFGMYGVFFAMLTTDLIEKSARKAFLTSISIFIGYNLVIGMKAGIDNAAHMGGLISGFVIGYMFTPGLKNPENRNLNLGAIAAAVVIVLMASIYIYHNTSSDYGTYAKRMEEFAALETIGLEPLKQTDTEKQMVEIKETGIPKFEECLSLIESLDKLDLPLDIRSRNRNVLTYCKLRVKIYKEYYRIYTTKSNLDSDSLRQYNFDLEEVLNKLGAKE